MRNYANGAQWFCVALSVHGFYGLDGFSPIVQLYFLTKVFSRAYEVHNPDKLLDSSICFARFKQSVTPFAI